MRIGSHSFDVVLASPDGELPVLLELVWGVKNAVRQGLKPYPALGPIDHSALLALAPIAPIQVNRELARKSINADQPSGGGPDLRRASDSDTPVLRRLSGPFSGCGMRARSAVDAVVRV